MTIQPEDGARVGGGLLLLALGAWILHSFLGYLSWAVVMALTTWPVYRKLAGWLAPANRQSWAAAMLALLIAAMILAPLGYGLIRMVDEAQSLAAMLVEAQNAGLPAPKWLQTVPGAGEWLEQQWNSTVGTADSAKDLFHWLQTGDALAHVKDFASQIMHRLFGLFITLLALFFLYGSGQSLGSQILRISGNMFGESGVRYLEHAVAAVRATVNGLVLLGLGEGLLLGLGYAVSGLSHPALLGAITGVFAMIPFAAKLVLAGCSLVLAAEGQVAAGVGLLVFGVIVIVVADNYVRPVLIGGSIKLPFLWTLLGIFGGLENFGLLGLFLGPTIMAVLTSIWRDSVEETI